MMCRSIFIVVYSSIVLSSCFLFQKKFVQSRPIGATLPYTQLGDPGRMLGRCVEYYPDGSFRTDECPEEMRVLFKKTEVRKYDGGYHDVALWSVKAERMPPAYRGEGGYTVAYESHQVELHFVNLAKASLDDNALVKLDRMCRHYPIGNSATVTEVYAGCGILHERPSPVSKKEMNKLLKSSGRSLGIPVNFKSQNGDSKKSPQCKGSPVTVAVKLSTLASLCRQVVLPSYSKVLSAQFERVKGEKVGKRAELAKLEARYQQLESAPPKKRDQTKIGTVQSEMTTLNGEVLSLDRELNGLKVRIEQYALGEAY